MDLRPTELPGTASLVDQLDSAGRRLARLRRAAHHLGSRSQSGCSSSCAMAATWLASCEALINSVRVVLQRARRDADVPLPCAANFVLESSCERRYVRDMFGDIPLGLYIIRGENVVMLAELVRSMSLVPVAAARSRAHAALPCSARWAGRGVGAFPPHAATRVGGGDSGCGACGGGGEYTWSRQCVGLYICAMTALSHAMGLRCTVPHAACSRPVRVT